MRRLVLLVVVAACTKAGAPAGDRVVDDFRKVEHACLARYATLDDLARGDALEPVVIASRIDKEVLAPWRELRARVEAATVPSARADLYGTMRHYLAERQAAWEARVAVLRAQTLDALHARADEERAHAALADADARTLDTAFQQLGLAALPPIAPDAGVALSPPPGAPPGPAYFLVSRQVVMLDGGGFRVIATDVDSMDVLPDGTLWACSMWNVVHWDGAHAQAIRPKRPTDACVAAPDGTAWLYDDRWAFREADHLSRFDGTTWTDLGAGVGEAYDHMSQMIADRDGVIYAVNEGHVWAYVDRAWKEVGLQSGFDGPHIGHMTRGADGHVWLLHQFQRGTDYPNALAQLAPSGGAAPVFVDDYFQQKWMEVSVDANSTPTILDLEDDTLVQGTIRRHLPLALTWSGRLNAPGPFAYDAAGRIWVELADGLSVIAPDGTRTVYPHGSDVAFRGPIQQIAVIGAGPTLPAPAPVVARTVTGIAVVGGTPLAGAAVALCDTAGDAAPPCSHAVLARSATTDASGHFTLPDVPRWDYQLGVRVEVAGPGPDAYDRWGYADVASDATDVGAIEPNVSSY